MGEVRGWRVDVNVDRYNVGLRPVRDGEPLPKIEAWHRAARKGVELWFKTAMGQDSRLVCTELDIRSSESLSTTALKRIPFTAILEYLSRRDLDSDDVGRPMILSTGLRRHHYSADELAEIEPQSIRDAFLANADSPAGELRPRRGGVGPKLTDLERFADAYRAAIKTRPRAAIAETVELLDAQGFKISAATAHRWRVACRQADPPILDPEPGDQS